MDGEINRTTASLIPAMIKIIQMRTEVSSQALSDSSVSEFEAYRRHATSIATDAIFWVRGADVRHALSLALD
ncbi:MAG TPA: hypothetical protein VGD64_04640 [Acidisarcina sp.]